MYSSKEILHVLNIFQEGYTARDVSRLDEFMQLFVQGDQTELIGIGAFARNQNEWFQGYDRIREIIKSDWLYWGDVLLNLDDVKITIKGEVAWLSTTGAILHTDHIHSNEVIGFVLSQMMETLQNESLTPKQRMVEATHYGVRRWRERENPAGHPSSFVFSAILVKDAGQWRFHTIHWSMPVE